LQRDAVDFRTGRLDELLPDCAADVTTVTCLVGALCPLRPPIN
jgi:hypothetical protein